MPQFIYTMKGLGKVHPPDAKVLEDIWLSFYFGAKIGVLGLNGAREGGQLAIRHVVGESLDVAERAVLHPHLAGELRHRLVGLDIGLRDRKNETIDIRH